MVCFFLVCSSISVVILSAFVVVSKAQNSAQFAAGPVPVCFLCSLSVCFTCCSNSFLKCLLHRLPLVLLSDRIRSFFRILCVCFPSVSHGTPGSFFLSQSHHRILFLISIYLMVRYLVHTHTQALRGHICEPFSVYPFS